MHPGIKPPPMLLLFIMKINTGDISPDFVLPSTSGTDFRLRDNLDVRKLVLYFYPKDFTSGCTAEACGFRDEFAELTKSNMRVFGISTDTLETHQKFKEKHSLPFDLLSDSSGEVSRLYGVYNKLFKMANRVTFVIGSDGKVLSVTKNLFAPGKHVSAARDQSESPGG